MSTERSDPAANVGAERRASGIRVLHVNDAADTARNLTAVARAAGQPWDLFAKASERTGWTGPRAQVQRAAIGAMWVARLAVAARRHDIVHVHSASTVAHSRFATRRYVVHCHGTDVRTAQYRYPDGGIIRKSLREAEFVFYATPDLAEHVLPYRGDAELLPVPIRTDLLPRWTGAEVRGRPRIAFAARWGEEKNATAMLECAAGLIAVLGDRAEIAGLDWGGRAAEAAQLGVRLYPRMDHPGYLRWLADSLVVIGQGTGSLGASELEAMGTGVPFAVPAPLTGYPQAPPLLAGSVPATLEAVAALVADPATYDPAPIRGWVVDHHDAARGVAQLNRVYPTVLAAR